MNKIRKLIECVVNVLIVIVAIILIFVGIYMIQTKVLHQDYANVFGYSIFQIATGSMSPTIETEDLVIVKVNEDSNKQIKENDIIVFKEGKDLITHRVIKINKDTIITKGDANNSQDKEIAKSAVVGKVVKTIHNIAVIKEVLHTPEVIASIVIAIILVIISMIYGSYADKKEEQQEEQKKELIKKLIIELKKAIQLKQNETEQSYIEQNTKEKKDA